MESVACTKILIFGVTVVLSASDQFGERRMTTGIVAKQFDFPYLCTVVHHQTWVGACSIISGEVVIVSVSNFNRPVRPRSIKMFYNDISGLTVFAGTVYMNPMLLNRGAMEGLQEVKVNSLYVAYNASNLKLTERIAPPNDENFNLSKILVMDVIDAKFNVAFLKVSPFKWTESVGPIPLRFDSSDVKQKTLNRLDMLEASPFVKSNCKIGGWHVPTGRMVYRHVLYVTNNSCKKTYCNYNLNACLNWNPHPRDTNQICFKAAHWGEPCATDTGAALFCEFFEGGNIFAILTTSINCGLDNLPSVYTTMLPVLQVYEELFGKY